MRTSTYKAFRDIAYDAAGINLGDKKMELVSTRVAKRLRRLGIGTPEEYLEFLRDNENEQVHFLDAISTNFTHFMREKDHFVRFGEMVEKWADSRRNRFRVWCAASSTGEEPYSIAMTVAEGFGNSVPDVKILATDINTQVLEKAKAGEYGQKELEPLSKSQRNRYFDRITRIGSEEQAFKAKPVLRDLLVFKRLNLATPPFPMSGPMDAVFCRNVMIYFDHNVRQKLTSEIERLMAPGALLFIGHSETLTGINTSLKLIKPSVYVKAQ